MTRTFIDSGVLIAAARGDTSLSFAALSILNDREREFASSVFIQLETIPKATYHKQQAEVRFYESFFSGVTLWATQLDQIVQTGHRLACTYGLAAIDALHLAAALSIDAEEFVTTEEALNPCTALQKFESFRLLVNKILAILRHREVPCKALKEKPLR